jgi:glycosyltransferase involved in cell wall biosynthesis
MSSQPGAARRPGLTVLHAVQPTDAGVARYVAATAVDQLRRGWQVVVASPPGGQLGAELVARGVPWLSWPATRGPGPWTMPETRRLRRLIHQVRPDVVHLHSAKAGLAGRLALRGSVPTLFQPHGWSWLAVHGVTARAALAWERRAADWADELVCAGDGEAELARCAQVGTHHVVVRNGVDLARFTPAGVARKALARTRLGVGNQVPLALCLGRVTRQKGQDVLLAAWPGVRRRCPRAELAVVGDGEMAASLLRGPIPGGVRFVPPVTDPRLWYSAADVVVLPSRWEGLSLTLLEALASGCPVVGSDIPGIAEVLPATVGAVVPAGDPAPLSWALAQRLGNSALCAGEGRRARLAAGAFDVRITHEQLATVTFAVAGRRGHTGSAAGRAVGGAAGRAAGRVAGKGPRSPGEPPVTRTA